jgi:protein-S-isoprenylcysteine O-methyltransferase Ste14
VGRLRAAWDQTPLPPQTVAGITVSLLAQHVRPFGLPAWTRPAGWAVVCGGFVLVTVAARERGPGSLTEPSTLVTEGVHARSRNPMYLGVSMVHVGLAGVTRNVWMLASSAVSAALLHRSILCEERWLKERFGSAYAAYTAEVPRWW